MSKLNIAVVGISGRAAWAIKALREYEKDVDIVALCDTVVAKGQWAKEQYELPMDTPCFSNVDELLTQVDCDAVMVMTTDAHHAEVTVPALQAGKRVFCEKPLETTVEKCRRIAEADAQAGGNTFVGFNLRYSPVYAKVKEILDSGELGRILTVQADEFYSGGRTYFRRWNRWREYSGGLWITKASHDFDIITWLVGSETPTTVYAVAERSYYVPKAGAAQRCRDCPLSDTCPDYMDFRNAKPSANIRENLGGESADLCLYNAGSDTFDHGIATITYGNDIFATYTCNVVAGFSDRRIRVACTKGTVEGSVNSPEVKILHRDSFRCEESIDVSTAFKGSHGGADDYVIDNFIAFAQGKAEPKCRPDEATLPVAIGVAARESSDTGAPVKMSELLTPTQLSK